MTNQRCNRLTQKREILQPAYAIATNLQYRAIFCNHIRATGQGREVRELLNQITHADCFDVFPDIPDGSIDMIFCDLPYGTTHNAWDKPLPLDELWSHYKRIIKPNGAIVLTAQPPFDKALAMSNSEMFRYEWIWAKSSPTGHLNANRMPLKAHENILVFYRSLPTYNPQKTSGHAPVNRYTKHTTDGSNYGKTAIGITGGGQTDRYPTDILHFPRDRERLHPTQKPLALCEYMIRTYTNEGDTVLDNCAGSCQIPIAAANTGRNFIAIEKEQHWAELGRERLQNLQIVMNL